MSSLIGPEREYVLKRDGYCFLVRVDPAHICRGPFGDAHAPSDLSRLTVDHVHRHKGGTKGKRAEDDRHHMTAMCWAGNVGIPSANVRQAQREYLDRVEP